MEAVVHLELLLEAGGLLIEKGTAYASRSRRTQQRPLRVRTIGLRLPSKWNGWTDTAIPRQKKSPKAPGAPALAAASLTGGAGARPGQCSEASCHSSG